MTADTERVQSHMARAVRWQRAEAPEPSRPVHAFAMKHARLAASLYNC